MSELIGSLIDTLKSFGKSGFQLGKSFIIDENGNVIPQSDISGAKVGFPSNTVNQIQNIPRVTSINPNTFVLGTAATAGAIGSTLIFTNPGVQQTVQANAGALQNLTSSLNDITKSTSNFTDFITKNPLILIALIGFGVLAVLKK